MKMKLSKKAQLLQFGRYLFVGGFAAIIEWAVFWLFSYRLHIFYLFSVAVAFIVATSVNYVLSAFFVFVRGRHRPRVECFLVFFVSAVGLCLNFILMWALHGRLNVPPLPAKIASTGIVFFWNYLSRRHFIFISCNRLQFKSRR